MANNGQANDVNNINRPRPKYPFTGQSQSHIITKEEYEKRKAEGEKDFKGIEYYSYFNEETWDWGICNFRNNVSYDSDSDEMGVPADPDIWVEFKFDVPKGKPFFAKTMDFRNFLKKHFDRKNPTSRIATYCSAGATVNCKSEEIRERMIKLFDGNYIRGYLTHVTRYDPKAKKEQSQNLETKMSPPQKDPLEKKRLEEYLRNKVPPLTMKYADPFVVTEKHAKNKERVFECQEFGPLLENNATSSRKDNKEYQGGKILSPSTPVDDRGTDDTFAIPKITKFGAGFSQALTQKSQLPFSSRHSSTTTTTTSVSSDGEYGHFPGSFPNSTSTNVFGQRNNDYRQNSGLYYSNQQSYRNYGYQQEYPSSGFMPRQRAHRNNSYQYQTQQDYNDFSNYDDEQYETQENFGNDDGEVYYDQKDDYESPDPVEYITIGLYNEQKGFYRKIHDRVEIFNLIYKKLQEAGVPTGGRTITDCYENARGDPYIVIQMDSIDTVRALIKAINDTVHTFENKLTSRIIAEFSTPGEIEKMVLRNEKENQKHAALRPPPRKQWDNFVHGWEGSAEWTSRRDLEDPREKLQISKKLVLDWEDKDLVEETLLEEMWTDLAVEMAVLDTVFHLINEIAGPENEVVG